MKRKNKENIEMANMIIDMCQSEVEKWGNIEEKIQDANLFTQQIKRERLNFCNEIIILNMKQIDFFKSLIEKWSK